ncbi:unnamed protein product [Phytomonas sp. Hart1]|nr:unnamed protein product [Phytomonas sp. Hart1]|eukprot:CCW67919.1 unnamed protein product [Phytomonas sp. isolate Hart1]
MWWYRNDISPLAHSTYDCCELSFSQGCHPPSPGRTQKSGMLWEKQKITPLGEDVCKAGSIPFMTLAHELEAKQGEILKIMILSQRLCPGGSKKN